MKTLSIATAFTFTLIVCAKAQAQYTEYFTGPAVNTKRVISDIFATSTQTDPRILRDEYLTSKCQGGDDISGVTMAWTSPFKTIYTSTEHYTYDQTVTLTTGQWLEVTDESKYSAYGSGGPQTMQGEAYEDITYGWYASNDWGETYDYMGNIQRSRYERKWYKRETTYVVKSPESTGGGGAG